MLLSRMGTIAFLLIAVNMFLPPLKRRRWSLAALLVIADMSCAFFVPTRTLPSSCRQSTLLHSSKSSENDRRSVIGVIIQSAALVCFQPSPSALAVEDRSGKKPFAPVDTLLPATRVLSMIDKAVDITTQLTTADTITQQRRSELLGKLENLLLKPQNYTRVQPISTCPNSPQKNISTATPDIEAGYPYSKGQARCLCRVAKLIHGRD